jgi:hypothetical protein
MMTWFAVWKTVGGDLVSVGTEVGSLPPGLSVTDMGEQQPSGVWNNVTHTFDPEVTLKAVLTLKAFAQRFTVAEREALFDMQQNGTAAQKKKLGSFKDYLQSCQGADLNDAYIQASVALMESAGVVAAGRAAQILA